MPPWCHTVTPLLRNQSPQSSPACLVAANSTSPLTCSAVLFITSTSSPHLNLNSSRYLILISLLTSLFFFPTTEVTELKIKYVYVSMWNCEYVIPFASKAIYVYLTLSFCVYCFCILYSWVFTHWLHWLLYDFWLLCCFLFVSSMGVGWGPWGLHCVVG